MTIFRTNIVINKHTLTNLMRLVLDVLLTEFEIESRFRDSILNGFLPEFLFYWSPVSVAAWTELCAGGPYQVYRRSLELTQACANELANRLPVLPLQVISLGVGDGAKDHMILNALANRGCSVDYVPVDASQALLEQACLRVSRPNWKVRGIKAEVTSSFQLETMTGFLNDNNTRLALVLGNNVGAWEPRRFLMQLNGLLRQGDFLVIDTEIYLGPETMKGFDNPPNRKFALAPLTTIGLLEDDGKLTFGIQEVPETSGFFLITKSFVTHRDSKISLTKESLVLRSGTEIKMNSSGKFTLDGFVKLIAESGFKCLAVYRGASERHVMVLAKRT